MIIAKQNETVYLPVPAFYESGDVLVLTRGQSSWEVPYRANNEYFVEMTVPGEIPTGSFTYSLGRNLGIILVEKSAEKPLAYDSRTTITEYVPRAYDSMEKVWNFLYRIKYTNSLTDSEIRDYFRKFRGSFPGGCSTVYNDGKMYRNFDWYYSNSAEFIITNCVPGKYKSIGLGGNIPALTDEVVSSGIDREEYRYLPYMMTDGMNEHGVCVSINVVPDDKGKTVGTNPDGRELCALYIPRYVLDNFTSAYEACMDIQFNCNVYCPESQEFHFLVCDKDDAFVVEFIENVTVVTQVNDRPYITNFHIDGVNWENLWDTVEDNGQGVERIKLLIDGTTDMSDLRYTKLVEVPWLTEFTGLEDGLTVRNAYYHPEMFDGILEKARTVYENRSRETADTWQTVHSVVYDLGEEKMMIHTQEDWDRGYEVSLEE